MKNQWTIPAMVILLQIKVLAQEETEMFLHSQPLPPTLFDKEENRFLMYNRQFLERDLVNQITPTSIGFNDLKPDGSNLVDQGIFLDTIKRSVREGIIRAPYAERVLGYLRGFFRKVVVGTIGNTEEVEVGTKSILSPSNTSWLNKVKKDGTEFGVRPGNSQYLYFSKLWRDIDKNQIAVTHLQCHLYSFPDSILNPTKIDFKSQKLELITEVPLAHGWALAGGITYSTRADEVEKGQKYLGSLKLEKKFKGDGSFVIGTEVFDRVSIVGAIFWNF
jgi:hypothetical protein